jgi:hypothetical protein
MYKIINKLNKIGRDFISETFGFYQKIPFLYVINGSNSTAINQKKNDKEKVNVLNWFDNFWLYVEIQFILNQSKIKVEIPNIFFSLSVFQGSYEDEEKTQLFRAEWDNYIEESAKHPQPHWHIYTQYDKIELYENFEELIKESGDSFNDFVKGKNDITPLNKFHFAMNGQWADNNTDVHKISNESDLTNWFSGLLNHIKKELEYLKLK